MHNLEFQQRTLDSVFLEILDDLSKKEVLLMVLCYIQLVRRENAFDVPLHELIRCSEKPHKNIKGDWRDIMMELDLFYISEDNKIYEGKDIFKVQNIYQPTVSIANIYKSDFSNISNLVTKYWNVVSKLSSFSDDGIDRKISTVILLFNEKLYKECLLYANMLRERSVSKSEQQFLDAVIDASFAMEFYLKDMQDRAKEYYKQAIERLNNLDDLYGIDIKGFAKSLDNFFKKSQKAKKESPKLTSYYYKKTTGFLSKLINKIKNLFNS